MVAVLTELDPSALTHSHAPPCRDNEHYIMCSLPGCVSILLSPFLPTLSCSFPSSAFLFLLPFHSSLSFFNHPPSIYSPPNTFPSLLLPFSPFPSHSITYLSTEKTRAIFPTALILFLITSFRCRMLEAASDV